MNIKVKENEQYAVITRQSEKAKNSKTGPGGITGIYWRPIWGHTIIRRNKGTNPIRPVCTWSQLLEYQEALKAGKVVKEEQPTEPEPKQEQPTEPEPVDLENLKMPQLRKVAVKAGKLTEEEANEIKGSGAKNRLIDIITA